MSAAAKRAAVLLLMLASSGAMAQAAQNPYPVTQIKWADYLKIITAMSTTGQGLYSVFVAEGVGPASVLVGFGLMFHLIQSIGGMGPQQRAKFIRWGFQVAIVMMLLASWTPAGLPQISGWKLPYSVSDILISPFDGLQCQVFARAGGMSQSCDSVNATTIAQGVPMQGINSLGKALYNIEAARNERTKARDAAMAKLSWYDRIANYFESMFAQIFSWATDLGVTAYTLLFGFELLILEIIAVAFGTLLMVVGPLMVPWLLIESLQQKLWGGWISNIAWLGVYKITAAVVVVLSLSTIGPVQDITSALVKNALSNIDPNTATWYLEFANAVITLGYLAIGFVLLLQTRKFASQLIR